MATPARSDHEKPASARINSCQADFQVTSPTGPLSSPETLLAALRREILPALSDVLDAPEWEGISLQADKIEIDLGHWPDDPVWSDVRHVLATKLRYALADYLPSTPSAFVLREAAALTQQRADTETDQAAVSQQQLAHQIETFVRWTQAAAENRTLPEILARLDRHSDERHALRYILRQRSSAGARKAQIPGHLLMEELRNTVSQALTLWEVRAEDKAQGLHVAVTDDPSVPQTRERRTRSLGQDSFADEQGSIRPMSQQDIPHDLNTAPEAPGPFTARVGEAVNASDDPSVPQTIDRRAQSLGHGSFADEQGSTRTMSQQDIPRDLNTAPRGPGPFTAHLREAKRRLIQSLLQAGVQEDIAQERSSVLLERLMPFLERRFTTDTEVSLDDTLPVNAATQSSARNEPASQEGTDDRQTPNVNHEDQHSDKPNGAVARPSTPDPANVPSSGDEGAPLETTPDRLARVTAAGNSDASNQDYAREITEIALALGIRQGELPKEFCIRHLIQNPDKIFAAASELGALNALVRLLAQDAPDARPLLAQTPLDPDKIKILHAADPGNFATALRKLDAADAFDLARRLLPANATLLTQHLTGLRDNAKSPRLAMQLVSLALLNGELLDFEDLAQRYEAPLATLRPAPGAHMDTTENGKTADEYGSPANPDPTGQTQAPQEESAQGTGRLAETVMFLAGFSALEVERILGIPATRRDAQADNQPRLNQTKAGSDKTAETRLTKSSDETGAPTNQPARGLSDADLIAKATTLTRALAGQDKGLLDDAADLLLRVWPRAYASDDTALKIAALRAALTVLTATEDTQFTLSGYLKAAAQEIEPDEEKRHSALRIVAARLGVPTGSDEPRLKRQTHAVIEALLDRPTRTSSQVKPEVQDEPPEVDSETFLVTEVAGLVLLNPFFTLLFERLKIEWNGKALHEDAYPKALGALHYLAGTTPGPAVDPFHRVILGLDRGAPLPVPPEPDRDAQALMDGLLRSVVDRWGKLGTTSPDGLRDTFLRRTGTLRFDDRGAHLRVTPGPFDMLLDGLPWSLERMILPWMPLPCHVAWREDHDA